MYEQTGRYYALFGPTASISPEEERFFAHWSAGCRTALDIGAGLCNSSVMLARLGLQVLAFEPSRVLATLAMDRLSRGGATERSITLVESDITAIGEPFMADLVLVRSVLMLLTNLERNAVVAAAARHGSVNVRLILDVRTAALSWVQQGARVEERQLGQTTYRRRTAYSAGAAGETIVTWTVDAERLGRTRRVAEEAFTVWPDTLSTVSSLLEPFGFHVHAAFGGYELERTFSHGDEVLVIVACRE